ncbi:hypothetical protein BSKO_02922 [Bryopsis sp. KO-2023]|nr:hypothetical protein BSKO_02922 [Bryopsis sp. KO-2023]
MVLVEDVQGLSHRLGVCFNDPGLSDVVVQTEDGGKFYCHKVVLAISSPVLNSMFRSSMKEGSEGKVVLKEVDSDALEWVLRACYTGKGDLTDSVIVPVMMIAKMYQIAWITNACRVYLSDSVNLDNCCPIFDQMVGMVNSGLQGKWARFIHKNIQTVSEGLQFLALSSTAMHALVKYETNRELCHALVKWLNHDHHARSEHFGYLLNELDLFELGRNDLVELMQLDIVKESSDLCEEISVFLAKSSAKAAPGAPAPASGAPAPALSAYPFGYGGIVKPPRAKTPPPARSSGQPLPSRRSANQPPAQASRSTTSKPSRPAPSVQRQPPAPPASWAAGRRPPPPPPGGAAGGPRPVISTASKQQAPSQVNLQRQQGKTQGFFNFRPFGQ